MQHRGTQLRIAMLAVVLLGALAAVSWLGRGSGAARGHLSPKLVGEVPSTLPPGGVAIEGLVLTPWTGTPRGAISAKASIAAARRFSDRGYPATTLAADLTEPGPIPPPGAHGKWHAINHVPVWVVTFTSPKPIDVNQGPGSGPIYVTHYSVAVNAVTGAFVRGFFET